MKRWKRYVNRTMVGAVLVLSFAAGAKGEPNSWEAWRLLNPTSGLFPQIVGVQQVPVLDYNGYPTTSVNNPSTGKGRVFYSTTDSQLHCLNSDGSSCLSSGGGSGTVTSFSSGNLSPLFTTSVATATTTPALSFTATSQSANLFYASPNGAPGVPTFRAIVAADLPAGTGTVTSIATTSPITGGPITTSGTIACGTCTTNAAGLTSNALVIGGGGQAVSALASLGTTTTVLHGNAGGAPTFGAVNLASDVTGQLSIGSVGSSGLSGTSPISISAAGAIACSTCNTSAATVTSVSFTGGLISIATPTTTPAFTVAGTSGGIPYFSSASTWATSAALTSNILVKGGGAGSAPTNSSVTDNGTTVSTSELATLSGNGALSASPLLLNGTLITGGSGTTTFPHFYINQGVAPTTFNTSGTQIGLNAPSGFAGSFIDFHVNGAASVFNISSTGQINTAAGVSSANGTITGLLMQVANNTGGALTFLNAANHINTATATTDVAGTIAISSSTSGSKTFTSAYNNAPNCVITPKSDPTAVGVWWVTTSTTTVTANIKVSGTINFTYICFAATN
jgi:hypothetical protein